VAVAAVHLSEKNTLYSMLLKQNLRLSMSQDGGDRMTNDADFIDTVFEPVSMAKPVVGSNITMRNPDVEIMAMTLNDSPLNSAGYGQLDNGRGWFNLKYLVLAVGPPGFSSVPYTHNKKKGDKEVGKKLYEQTEDGHTRFYSYAKGKTNKDRGDRTSTYAAEDTPECDVTAVVKPGMCLTQFFRIDDYEADKKMIISNEAHDVLPAFSVVYMQLSSSNCEQASKGRLLKIRKIKVPSEPVEWYNCMPSLPSTPAEFREVNSSDLNSSIREQFDSRSNCVFYQFTVQKTAFTVTDDSDLLLCEAGSNLDQALFSADLLSHVLPNANDAQRIKFFNLAIATGAVKVLVKSLKQEDNFIMDSSTEKYTDKIIAVHIDFNTFMGFEQINSKIMSDSKNDVVQYLFTGDGRIMAWSKGDVYGEQQSNQNNRIAFSILLEPVNNDGAHELPSSNTLFDRNASGVYYRVRLHMLTATNLSDFVVKLNANDNESCLITLEYRTHNRAVGGAKKRKRPLIEYEVD
tara:strand:+ start:862 stop:2409 length:1548 start_codon:yes stop_codon:yes gene_type:complete